eukprot:364159-Chlamydomonas_euryale.AAC.2
MQRRQKTLPAKRTRPNSCCRFRSLPDIQIHAQACHVPLTRVGSRRCGSGAIRIRRGASLCSIPPSTIRKLPNGRGRDPAQRRSAGNSNRAAPAAP